MRPKGWKNDPRWREYDDRKKIEKIIRFHALAEWEAQQARHQAERQFNLTQTDKAKPH